MIFALVGSPPFSIFLSEVIILVAAFLKGAYLASALFLIFIAVIFAGVIFHLTKIIFGKKPEGMKVSKESVSTKAAFLFLLIFICVMGFRIPAIINKVLLLAVDVIRGA